MSAIFVATALLVLAWADHGGLLLYPGHDWSRYEGRTFRVASVTDGDTIRVDCPDGPQTTTRIRLWGIDCPETAKPGRPVQPFADEATQLTRQLCLGQQVTLRLEPHEIRDKFGRLVAYVELPDDRTLLNERLLSAGLARADDRFSHRYMDRFAELEEQARRDGVGLWGPSPSAGGRP